MVRAGKNAVIIDDFKQKNLVAIGWGLGDLTGKTKYDIKELVNEKYPQNNKNQNAIIVSQEFKFLTEIKIGDYVLSYNPSTRNYLLGEIISDYTYSDIITNQFEDDDYSDKKCKLVR